MPAQTAAKSMVVPALRSRFERLIHLPNGQRTPGQIRRQAAATLAAQLGLADVLLVSVDSAFFEKAFEVSLTCAFSAWLKRPNSSHVLAVGD